MKWAVTERQELLQMSRKTVKGLEKGRFGQQIVRRMAVWCALLLRRGEKFLVSSIVLEEAGYIYMYTRVFVQPDK